MTPSARRPPCEPRPLVAVALVLFAGCKTGFADGSTDCETLTPVAVAPETTADEPARARYPNRRHRS